MTRQTSNRTKTPSALKDERETPRYFFYCVEERLGMEFDVDLCATKENTKVPGDYFTKEMNPLELFERDTFSCYHLAWCNPPYSDIPPWLDLARRLRLFGITTVMLLQPRTDQRLWFHPPKGLMDDASEVLFLYPRIHFPIPGQPTGSPDFGSMLVTFAPTLMRGGPRVETWRWK